MAIYQDYLKEFVPVHELDRMTLNTQFDDNGNPTLCDLKRGDLFLISQLSAKVDDETSGVMVSKSLEYGNMIDVISNDFQIQLMKDRIKKISCDLCEMSVDVYEVQLPSVYNTICCVSTYLSTDYVEKISAAAHSLSTDYGLKFHWVSADFVPNVSARIDLKKTDKYDLTLSVERDGHYITRLTVKDGLLQPIGEADMDMVQNHFDITGTKVAGGTIVGESIGQETFVVSAEGVYEIRHYVPDDCYVTIDATVLDMDSDEKPIEVYLHNPNLSGDTYAPYDVKVYQFNNPGGFSGKRYMSYYFTGFPVKLLSTSMHRTYVSLKYSDGHSFTVGDADIGMTKVKFTDFSFFATIAKGDIEKYVKKPNWEKDYTHTKDLYKFALDSNGFVTDLEKVTLADLTSIMPPVTPTDPNKPGTVRLGYVRQTATDPLELPLSADSSGCAFVQANGATADNYGTVKLGYVGSQSGLTQYLALRSESGRAYVSIDAASVGNYGTVRLSHSSSSTEPTQIMALKQDADGAYTEVHAATPGGGYGTVKLAPSEAIPALNNFMLKADGAGLAYVTVPTASTSVPGVIKTGLKTNVGQVYIDTDGIAKVTSPAATMPLATQDTAGIVKVFNYTGAAGQVYLDSDGRANVTGFLPSSGGACGTIVNTGGVVAVQNVNSRYSYLCGGSNVGYGGHLLLLGDEYAEPYFEPGSFELKACLRNVGEHALYGTPHGSLTWDGKKVLTTLDLPNYIASAENYDVAWQLSVADSNAFDYGYGEHPRYYWYLDAVHGECYSNRPFTAMITYKHWCTDKPDYGIHVKLVNSKYKDIADVLFHPKYSLAYKITKDYGTERDDRFIGSFSQFSKLIVLSDNKGFTGGGFSDSVYLYIKYLDT